MTAALTFLHADGGPVARSPMGRDTAAAGARTEQRDGWEVAVGYADAAAELHACRETVGFGDRSHLGKLELQGSAAALDALESMPALAGGAASGDREGATAAGGLAIRADDAWWCRITPERALIVCEASATAALRERLAGSFAGHVLDVTATYGALVLAGPLARETFARFCALDLRPQSTPLHGFRPGSVARTPGYVVREADDRYLTLFGAAYGSYLWEVVADAATHLGGRPVGEDTLAALAGTDADAEPTTTEAGSHA